MNKSDFMDQQNRGGSIAANERTDLVRSKNNLRCCLEGENVRLTLDKISTRWFSAEQIKTQAIIAVTRNADLLNCTVPSFLEAMVQAAECGLRFAGANGEAYLVRYGSRCVFIPGYRGLLALARRTGKVFRIEARSVYEKDEFKILYGSSPQLIHQPCLSNDRGQVICVYALAELKDGSIQIEVMTPAEIEAVRQRSPAKNNGPWMSDSEMMARKTVLRRLCKYLPFPTAFEDSLMAEDPDEERKQQSRFIEASGMPNEQIDKNTGEVLSTSETRTSSRIDRPVEQTQIEKSPPATIIGEPVEPTPTVVKDLLLREIRSVLVNRWPGKTEDEKKSRREEAKHVFGTDDWAEITSLPENILIVGIQELQRRAAAKQQDELL
jgi:recombination protein RecT